LLWFSGTPESGQYNNGVISPVGPGVTASSAKVYYLSSSTPTSRPRVGFKMSGSGFEPNKSVSFGVEGESGKPTEPWGTGTVSLPSPIMADENGEFEYSVSFSRASPSAYNKFDSYGGEKLIVYPTYQDGVRIDGVQLTLTIRPTIIVLPRILDPITIFAGADYSSSSFEDNGVTSKIIDDSSRQVRLAVAGISLRGAGNEELQRVNDAWQLPNGVTASPNADSSFIVFRTDKEGATGAFDETLSIFGTGASVVDDGFASVAGFPKAAARIGTLNLNVKKSDRSVSPKLDPVIFKNNETANVSVEFDKNPSNLTISDLLIVDPATKARVGSIKALDGLVITADPKRGALVFSGTPSIVSGTGEGNYEVVCVTTDGDELSSSINVAVSAGDVYVPSYQTTEIGDGVGDPGYWLKGVAVPETRRPISAVKADGSGASIPLKLTVENAGEFDGLDIDVTSGNDGIAISGVPNFSGHKTLYVTLSPDGSISGTISPNRVAFKIFADDATYQLGFDREKLEVPVGMEFSTNVNELTEPKYERDSTPRDFTLTGAGVTGGPGIWYWNGLTITDIENTATWNSWLEVSGKAEREETVELTYAPSRGGNMSSAKFTIVAHKDESVTETPAETEVVTNADDPVVTASDDARYETPVAGETTKIIYIISNDVSQTGGTTVNNYINIQAVNLALPDGTIIPLANLNDNLAAAGPFTGAPNSYYFDRASGQIILYVTPETVGNYQCNVYYKDATTLRMQPVNLTVTETTNYYYTENSGGGGGCGTGAAAWFAALFMTTASLIGAWRGGKSRGNLK
jgi:hypothetical protein